jgi:magnesium transporter
VDLSNTLKTERVAQTASLLTIVATVLLVPTLLAGIWGMNFERVPGAEHRLGFWGALAVLLVAAGLAWIVILWLHRRQRH